MANYKYPNQDFSRGVEKAPANFMLFSEKNREEWLKDVMFDRNMSGKPFTTISISKSQFKLIDDSFIDFIKKNFADKPFIIDVSYDAVFEPEEFAKINEIKQELEKNNISLYFHENNSYYGYNKVVEANNKLDKWANEINNLTIDGKKLSPLEKYYVAYSYVTQFPYQESNLGDHSRNLISVLTGDKIVCVGYAQIFKALCSKIGIECDTQVVAIDSNKINHMNCTVTLDDPKYGIKGVYYSDPCYDCLSKDNESSFSHSLITYNNLPRLFKKHSVIVCLDSNLTNINTFFEDKESVEKSKQGISEYLASLSDNFSKYIDECVKVGSDRLFTKTPKEKDFHMIIDKIIYDRIDLYAYGNHKSPNLRRAIAYGKENMQETANLIMKYVKKKNLGEFKRQLLEEMKTYVPSFDSESFVMLSDAYTRLEKSKADTVVEEKKASSTDLTFVNLEALLGNLSKIQGEMEVELCKNPSDMIKFSVNRAIATWGDKSTPCNVYGTIKDTFVRNVSAGRGIGSGKELMEVHRAYLERIGVIRKKPDPASVSEPKPLGFGLRRTPKTSEPQPFKPFILPKPESEKNTDEPKTFVVPPVKSTNSNPTGKSGNSQVDAKKQEEIQMIEDFLNGKS